MSHEIMNHKLENPNRIAIEYQNKIDQKVDRAYYQRYLVFQIRTKDDETQKYTALSSHQSSQSICIWNDVFLGRPGLDYVVSWTSTWKNILTSLYKALIKTVHDELRGKTNRNKQ